MRRIVFFIAIIIAFSKIYGQGLSIGVYAEPQFAWINSDGGSVVNDGSIFNLNSGIEFDNFFMPNYAFTIGLNLNNLGGKLNYQEEVSFEQEDDTLLIAAGSGLKIKTQYIGIPIGLKLKTEELGYNTFYVHLGLAPFLNTKATAIADNSPDDIENIKSGINFLSLNYFAELGIEHRLAGSTAIIAGFKWSAGFNDISSNDGANIHHTSAGLHIGILF